MQTDHSPIWRQNEINQRMAHSSRSFRVELSPELSDYLEIFLKKYPHLERDWLIQMGLSLLLSNSPFNPSGKTERLKMARIYLDTLFGVERDNSGRVTGVRAFSEEVEREFSFWQQLNSGRHSENPARARSIALCHGAEPSGDK